MKVFVDRTLCEANGLCVLSAPEVFGLDGNDTLDVLDAAPAAEHHAAVREAVRQCPRRALSVNEDDASR